MESKEEETRGQEVLREVQGIYHVMFGAIHEVSWLQASLSGL